MVKVCWVGGLVSLVAGFSWLAPWLGLIVLGVAMMAHGYLLHLVARKVEQDAKKTEQK